MLLYLFPRHFLIYTHGIEYIERHNYKEPKASYTLGHNFFSDMTVQEYHQYNFLGEFSPGIRYSMTHDSKNHLRGGLFVVKHSAIAATTTTATSTSTTTSRVMSEVMDVEDSMNWVDRGGVTPIKNQGMCGACKCVCVCVCVCAFFRHFECF